MTRTLIALHTPFCEKYPDHHLFLNHKIIHSRPKIEINFKERDWATMLEYSNLKARGGYNNKEDSTIFLNDKDISDQDIENFNYKNYEHLIKIDNNITITFERNYDYSLFTWVVPLHFSEKEREDFISSEIKKWN